MTVRLKVTGTQAFEQRTRAFMSQLRTRLRRSFEAQSVRLMQQALSNVSASGLRSRSGELMATARATGGVKGTRAFIRVDWDQPGAPYAAWQEYGLVPRPWHQRAISRQGRINPRLGKARTASGKPWGLPARHFLRDAGQQTLPGIQQSAQQALEDTISAWNISRGFDFNA
jgi:hypothetical protein